MKRKKTFFAPSPGSGPVKLADFIELVALHVSDGKVSKQDVISRLKQAGEEDDDKYEIEVNEAFTELYERLQHMGNGAEYYPFRIEGDLLKRKRSRYIKKQGFLYLFLLLSTRMDMKKEGTQKVQNGKRIDATKIFEHLCLAVAKCYWGGSSDPRIKGLVFGTGRNLDVGSGPRRPSGFKGSVEELCLLLEERGKYRPTDPHRVTAKDDTLDVVVWRNFSDRRKGKLIGFGQCKTGDSWENDLCSLQPEKFCQNWMETSPTTPVRLFFLSDRVVEHWNRKCNNAGILFDRCRILDYADEVPKMLLSLCAEWTFSALDTKGLQY